MAQDVEYDTDQVKSLCSAERNLLMISVDNKSLSQIRSCFVNLGFFDLRVEYAEDGEPVIREGSRYRISHIRVRPDSVSSPLSLLHGSYFSNTGLERAIDSWVRVMNSEGFLFAEVRIHRLDPDSLNSEVGLEVEVDKGGRYRSGKITFSGAEVNSQDYLKKISGAMDSMLITPAYLNSLQGALQQSEILNRVSTPVVRFRESGEHEIFIELQERSLNQFDGILGYVPDNTGNAQIVGEFDLSLWNALAQGNGVQFNFERLRPENTRLQAEVRQHWVGDLPLGGAIKGSFFQNDSSYQYRNVRLEGYYVARSGLRLRGAVGASASVEGVNKARNIEPDGSGRSAEIGFSLNGLDRNEVPRSGGRVDVRFGLNRRSVDIDSVRSFSQRYLAVSGAWYTSLSGRHIIATRSELFLLNAGQLTDSDLYRFGGANSLRGYAEEQFTASVAAWGEAEYRYLATPESYLFLFAAAGYYERPRLLTETDNQLVNSGFLQSAGFGISYRIRIGRLRFTYALSPQESFANGKVHLGIVTDL